METRMEKPLTILPGMCDAKGLLGIPDTLGLFMDIAAEHAQALGCGVHVLGERGLFWLTVRSRVRFFRRPRLMDRVSLATWPEAPGKLRADRDYVLTREGELLAAGKTEWAVLDRNTGRLRSPGEVYGPDLRFSGETVWEEPFSRLADAPLEEYARYVVRSTDMDLGEHMNNVAYVRALAGTFSGEEWQALDPQELEIAYRNPCREGDTLVWQRRREADGSLLLRAAPAEGKAAVLARLIPRARQESDQ